jgi:uncharacterized membrane protein YfcA
MAPAVLAVIAVTIAVTSFISGIFGMAGGIILLGVLLIFLDVAPAMMLFGTIQMASNGWRAALWRRYVDWGIVWRYLVGSTLMFLALRSVAIIPSKAVIYLGLGLIRSLPTSCPSASHPTSRGPARLISAAPSSSCCSCWRARPATSSMCSSRRAGWIANRSWPPRP